MKSALYFSTILSILVCGPALPATSAVISTDELTPAGVASHSHRQAPFTLAQYIPCPNGRCR